MANTRHLFRQSHTDIAALLRGTASTGMNRETFAAMDRGENSFDHLYPTPPAPSRDQGHDMSRQQGAGGSNQGSGIDQQYLAVDAITKPGGLHTGSTRRAFQERDGSPYRRVSPPTVDTPR